VEVKLLQRATSKLALERLVIKKGAFVGDAAAAADKGVSLNAQDLLDVLQSNLGLEVRCSHREGAGFLSLQPLRPVVTSQSHFGSLQETVTSCSPTSRTWLKLRMRCMCYKQETAQRLLEGTVQVLLQTLQAHHTI
jgi:hypothetical protein